MKPRQKEFEFRSWGGKRRGAGRKPIGEKAGVSHAKRPVLAARFPVHVTVKLEKGLPSLRRKAVYRALRHAFAASSGRHEFRVVEHSVLSNHVHFIAESSDERTLARGVQGLCVRIARALNRLWRRVGSVFADRYHARILRTPREVRNALVYVLQNARRHGIWAAREADPYSSGGTFDGWKGKEREERAAADRCGFLTRARTWLLRAGWRRHGLLDIRELPATS
jgi:REP element-mobilizing transposase RayT